MNDSLFTSKEFLDFLITVLASSSFWKFLLLLLLVLYAIPIGKVILRVVEFILNYHKKKQDVAQIEIDKLKLKIEKEEKDKMFESFKLAIDQVNTHNDLIETILKTLQLSPSNYKYEVLLESFLGLDRSFCGDIKNKLLYYIEQGRTEKFMYVKKEIAVSFKDKVLNKIGLFIFNDINYFDDIYNYAKEQLDIFISPFEFISDVEEARLLLDDSSSGIVPVLSNIQQTIIIEYLKRFSGNPQVDYLRRSQ